jgi:hypothetical protein
MITGLQPNTKYYVRPYATNSSGTGYGPELWITTPKLPSTITITGANQTYIYNGQPQGPTTATTTGSTGAVTYSYSGIMSTTYTASATRPSAIGTYQVIATVAADSLYGAASTGYVFTISAVATPTVTMFSLTSTSATIGGVISPTGGSNITEKGVVWGTSSSPTLQNNKTVDTSPAFTYSSTITGLQPNTKYYARLYATTSFGTTYGYEIMFITPKLSSTITITGTNPTYTYTGQPQGPNTATKTGSTGAVTYSYSGIASTTYAASATAPTAIGTYQVIATLASDTTYNGASTSYVFTIIKASSTVSFSGTSIYTSNGQPQGPTIATRTGSTGTITYSYSGTGSTIYAASANKPTLKGTYQVIATIAPDANYNGVTSSPFAFTIN